MDFYYKYILEIPDYIPQTNILNNLERGILIHKTLEELYTPYLKNKWKFHIMIKFLYVFIWKFLKKNSKKILIIGG